MKIIITDKRYVTRGLMVIPAAIALTVVWCLWPHETSGFVFFALVFVYAIGTLIGDRSALHGWFLLPVAGAILFLSCVGVDYSSIPYQFGWIIIFAVLGIFVFLKRLNKDKD